MTRDPARADPRNQPTEPVEVQRYGPPHPHDPHRVSWDAAPAWSSRPSHASAASPQRGSLGAMPVVVIAVVAGILSGALSAVAVSNVMFERGSQGAAAGDATPDADRVTDLRIDESSAVITAVDRVAPAVVTIRTSGAGGLFGGSSGTGSGFIYHPDGWILTNRHVVEGAQDLLVLLDDGRQFTAEVYGIDTLTDLAILKIEATDLPTAPVGTSAGLQPGQLAIAIGNPLGYENTVTTGVVSGLGRQITASDANQTRAETLRNLIQTDAAINPGNSGGPLVNSAGQVIGVNTAVANVERAQGIGFAIPIDVARPIMQQALDGVHPLVRPWIGVYYLPVNPALATDEDLPVDYGAYLATTDGAEPIFPGSPADVAGLRAGDVIVAVDGKRITAEEDLSSLILPHSPGDRITLRVLRENTTREIDVTLGELPADN